jgi:4-azaleucine resistance transporter AzlC
MPMTDTLIAAPPGRLRELLAGIRDQLPILLGVIPFGLIFGALAIEIGLPRIAAQGLSLLVFAGSAQFAAVGLIANAVPALVVVLTVLIINLRHALYSAAMAPHLDHLPVRWKLVLAWLLTDEAFAVASARYRRNVGPDTHWYLFGTGMALWLSWQASTAAGILLAAGLPRQLQLDFALPLTFLALLIPSLTDRPAAAAAVTGGVLAVALNGLPFGLGLPAAVVVAVPVGWLLERRARPITPPAKAGQP